MIKIKLSNKCLWCDDKEIPMDKTLCSMKCLSDLKQAVEKEHGKGKCGFDKSDVYFKRERMKG